MSIVQLDILLAYAAVKRQSSVRGSKPWRAWLLASLVQEEGFIQQPKQSEANCETHEGHKNPVVTQPENDFYISPVPTVAKVVGEEAPRVVVVLVGEKNAEPIITLGALVHVVAPDKTEVQRTGRCHNCNIWERPTAIIVGERVNCLEEKWVAGDCAHNIVGDARRDCAANPGRVGEKRVEATVASLETISLAQWHSYKKNVHRPSQCRCRQSGAAQSTVSYRRAGWGKGSCQTSQETMDIRQR